MAENDNWLRLSDGHLFFESAGKGEAVVFLHGFGLDSRMWEPQYQALQSKALQSQAVQYKALQSSFRVIRYDLRGFGRSSLPPAAGYAHEDDLNALLTKLGAAPAHVVGFSMGGQMALRFAAAYPQSVRSLVLADSALDGQTWSADWKARWTALCNAARAGQMTDAKRQWLEHPLFDSARSEPSRASLLAGMIEGYSGWHWHNRDTARIPSPPLAQRLGEIRVPSLVITGSNDLADFQIVGNVLAAGLPSVRRLNIEGSGHIVNLEAPNEFNNALLEFWEGNKTQESTG
jgi:3-oxoadipate enol-lactonase